MTTTSPTLRQLIHKDPIPALPSLSQVLILVLLRSHPDGLYGLDAVDRIVRALSNAKAPQPHQALARYYDDLKALRATGLVESKQGERIAANTHRWRYFITAQGEAAVSQVENVWGDLSGLPL